MTALDGIVKLKLIQLKDGKPQLNDATVFLLSFILRS